MSYHVVTLEHDDPLVKRHKFHQIGSDLLRESILMRASAVYRETRDSSFLHALERVEVYSFGECMPGYENKVSERMRFHLPTPEYQRFAKVYFLNDLALRMYREGGVEFKVAKVILDEELPKGCTTCLSGPYFPKEVQGQTSGHT